MSLLPAASSCCDPCSNPVTTTININDLIEDAIGAREGIINVLDYGATGLGTGDDSAAVQEAADAAAGKTLYFPSGYTFLLSQIDLPSNLIVTGGGTLKFATNTSAFYLLQAEGQSNVHIDSLIFDGNISNQAVWSEHRHCLKIYDTSNVTVSRCTFKDPIGDCIYASHGDSAVAPFTGYSNLLITGCFFLGASLNRNGVSLVTGTDARVTNNYFYKMARFDMPGAIDIETHIAGEFIKNTVIADNQFIGHASPTLQQGISVNNNIVDGEVTGLSITNNVMDGKFRYNVALFGNDSGSGIDEAQIIGNTFRNNLGVSGGVGILTRDTFVTISGNKLYDIDDAGIKVLSGQYLIADNYIINAGEYGLHFTGTMRGVATNNYIFGAGATSSNAARGAIYFDGSDSVFIGNQLIGSGTSTQQGFYGPAGTNNYFAGNFIKDIASKNYNIATAQRWGIDSPYAIGGSFDIVQERDIHLWPTIDYADQGSLCFGNRADTINDPRIRRAFEELQVVLPDGVGGFVFGKWRCGLLSAGQVVSTGAVSSVLISATGLTSFANNAAALGGGLVAGDFYTVTGTDPLQVAKVF